MKIALLFLSMWAGWSDYAGSPDSSQYSSLTQINRANVTQLKLAWTYPIEDSNHYAFSPVIVDSVIYFWPQQLHRRPERC